jgi:ferredoxin like protein
MSEGNNSNAAAVEGKLFQNRYIVDGGHPHIVVKPHQKPSKRLLALLRACPAGCYAQNEQGQVEVSTDGCLECGTCRVLALGEIEWNYPRGGYGIMFKFG